MLVAQGAELGVRIQEIEEQAYAISGTPFNIASPRQIQEIAETLLQRNHREAVVKGVLGGNFRRVASEVWK